MTTCAQVRAIALPLKVSSRLAQSLKWYLPTHHTSVTVRAGDAHTDHRQGRIHARARGGLTAPVCGAFGAREREVEGVEDRDASLDHDAVRDREGCERWRIVERSYGAAERFRCADVSRSCDDPDDTEQHYCGRRRTGACSAGGVVLQGAAESGTVA